MTLATTLLTSSSPAVMSNESTKAPRFSSSPSFAASREVAATLFPALMAALAISRPNPEEQPVINQVGMTGFVSMNSGRLDLGFGERIAD